MTQQPFVFPQDGNYEVAVPPGYLPSVVTYLERDTLPDAAPDTPAGFRPEWAPNLSGAQYKEMFAAIGGPWLWYGQLLISDEEIERRLDEEATQFCLVYDDGTCAGFVEAGMCGEATADLRYIGLLAGYDGRGLGQYLMEAALFRLRKRHRATRAVVHSCTLDHPRALGFYQRHGFQPVRRTVELAPDPRRTGHLAPDLRPEIAVL